MTQNQSSPSGEPHRFVAKGIVDAPIEKLWAMVGDFAGVMKWHPKVTGCTVEGAGVGAVRTVDMGGRQIRERLEELDHERHTLSYSIVEGRPVSVGTTGRIGLEATSDGGTSVEWVTTIPDRPGAAELAAELSAYYPTRIADMGFYVAQQE